MRKLGLFLFLAGFLAGAFVIVQQRMAVNWLHYGAACALSVAGVVVLRLTSKGEATAENVLTQNMQLVLTSLEQLQSKLHKLNETRDEVGVYGICNHIDNELMADLSNFVAARETVIQKHGLDTYARMMDAFAGGERALNRAWSASADGYIDEAWSSLDRAERGFQTALSHVRKA